MFTGSRRGPSPARCRRRCFSMQDAATCSSGTRGAAEGPGWAIGTGKTATPGQAEEVHDFIRQFLERIHGTEIAAGTCILYGGSVNPDNAGSLMAQRDIDE